MSDKPNNITHDDILIVAFIACDCGNYAANEPFSNDKPYVAELFTEDGWRKIDDKIYCPGCAGKKGRDKK